MHPVMGILLILLLIWVVLLRRWMDQVERGVVSSSKYEVVVFLMLIIILPVLWRSSFELITKMCYGMLAGLHLIPIINRITNSSEKSQDDLRIWSGHTVLLMFGTGALTLMIYVPGSIREIILLHGFIGVVFYQMFLWTPR